MLILLLLAINNRPIRLVIMAWHIQRDLVSWVFGTLFVKDKAIGPYCHIASQQQPSFSVCCAPCHLLLSCGFRRISSGTNLAPESLCTVGSSGTLPGIQVTVANCPVTNKVDCCEDFYSFTNQMFVLWRLGTSQEDGNRCQCHSLCFTL
jgi:hypothetical protein